MSAALALFVVVLLAGAGGFGYVFVLALREIMATRERFQKGGFRGYNYR